MQCVLVCRSQRSALSPDALHLSGTDSRPRVTSLVGQTEWREGAVEGKGVERGWRRRNRERDRGRGSERDEGRLTGERRRKKRDKRRGEKKMEDEEV